MKASLLSMAVLLVGALAPSGQIQTQAQRDEAAVRQALNERWAAQERADAATFSAYFAEDADFVNVVGQRWRGRSEIAKDLGAFTLANTQDRSGWKNNIESVRFVRPDVAIVHVRWQTPSRRTSTGRELGPSSGIATQVFVKNGGQWYVTALQNTLCSRRERDVYVPLGQCGP